MKKQFLLILAIGLINPVNSMNQIPGWQIKTSKFINGLCFAGYTALSFRKAYNDSPWNPHVKEQLRNLPDASPELTQYVRTTCKEVDVRKAENIVVKFNPKAQNEPYPNASAYTWENGIIIVNPLFIELFEQNGGTPYLKFITGHEARHITSKDGQKSVALETAQPFIAYGILKVLEKKTPIQSSSALGFVLKNSLKIVGWPMYFLGTGLAINYLKSYIFEQRADKEAALLLGPQGTKGGIYWLERMDELLDEPWRNYPHHHRVFLGHPSDQERIGHLKKIERELNDSQEKLD